MVEALVRKHGAAGVTIGAVAHAAGISKGGVQSAFGTKEQLLQAVLDRWAAGYDAAVARIAGAAPDARAAFAAHIETTRRTDDTDVDRAAGVMVTALSSPKIQAQVADWYKALLDRADPKTVEGRRARLAIIATEGAYLLRGFGVLQVSEAEWESLFEDIAQLVPLT
jgi:AcrR family transcriptional regulator